MRPSTREQVDARVQTCVMPESAMSRQRPNSVAQRNDAASHEERPTLQLREAVVVGAVRCLAEHLLRLHGSA
jgi:hypothetical protein